MEVVHIKPGNSWYSSLTKLKLTVILRFWEIFIENGNFYTVWKNLKKNTSGREYTLFIRVFTQISHFELIMSIGFCKIQKWIIFRQILPTYLFISQ